MKTAATWGGTGKIGRWLACLVLVAFTLQSYVAQTHIHDLAPASVGKTLHAPALNKALGGKSPLDNSPMDCPLCQAVAHDGIFFIPASPLLFLSSVWIEMAAPVVRLAASSGARAHNWQSRAPPLH